MALKIELSVASLPRIEGLVPRRLDTALFGVGSFSDTESRFGIEKGVWRTINGYSGGRYEKPSHEDPGDHVEVVMVEYASLSLTYGQLLDIFLNRCGDWEDSFPQCVSYIFVKNESEKRLAEAAFARYKLCSGNSSDVKISAYKTFYKAEQWRQKCFLRSAPLLMDELLHVYPNEERLLQSTLATRLNGILGQCLSRNIPESIFPDDFELYDLSEKAAAILKNAVSLPVNKMWHNNEIKGVLSL